MTLNLQYAEQIYEFSGIVSAVTPDGNTAFVSLDTKVVVGDKDDTVEYAVISHETVGRIEMLNGKGRFIIGTHVKGRGRRAPDSLIAVSVTVLEDA